MMDLTAVLVVLVTAAAVVKIVRIRTQSGIARGAHDTKIGELLARMERLEKRMANLETIVLDAEKHKQFEQVL
jgi:hypothetical protein